MRLILLAALSLASIANVVAQNKGKLQTSAFTFQANSGQIVEAEKGTLFVPENHSNPKGTQIELAFVRFPSTSTNPSFPIIYLAGGPGGSGISLAKGPRFPLFMAMREFGDVIALDQRGTGLSKPNLTCPQTLDYPLDMPTNKDTALKMYKERSIACAAHWRSLGVNLAAYNTNENADDIEDLRVSLGTDKVTLWGSSYGTHLGLVFIRRHSNSVDKAVFAGVEGPEDTFKLPSAFIAQINIVSSLIEQDNGVSHEIPDFVEMIKRVLLDVSKRPLEIETSSGPITLGMFDVQQLTFALLSDRAGKEVLPALYYDLDKRNLNSRYLKYFAQLIASQRLNSIGSAMGFATDCASYATRSRLAQIKREGKESLLGDSPDFPFPDVCSSWGSSELGDTFRGPIRSNVRALFLSGTFDGRTPPGNADKVIKGFPNARHVLIEGAGHGDELFTSSPEIRNVILAFMRDGKPLPSKIQLPKIKFRPLSN